jgi:putative spermidine/putrescine transport system substrate-binding protein
MGDTHDPQRGEVSRRTVLKAAATGATIAGAPWVWRRAHAQAKRIVIRDPGGPFAVAFQEAYYKPFRAATGIEAVGVAAAHEPTSQVKAMVDSKTYTWDMALLSQAAADQLVKDGAYLERLDLDNHPDVAEVRSEFRSPYFVGNDVYTAIIAYRTDAFKGKKAPVSWKDLWDVKGFPGRRSLRKHPFDTIEEALLADGVPKDKLYPCDVDRALRSLDRI